MHLWFHLWPRTLRVQSRPVSATRLRQALQQVCDEIILGTALWFVLKIGLADTEFPAGPRDTISFAATAFPTNARGTERAVSFIQGTLAADQCVCSGPQRSSSIAVLVFGRLHLAHRRCAHSAKLRAPLIEACSTGPSRGKLEKRSRGFWPEEART